MARPTRTVVALSTLLFLRFVFVLRRRGMTIFTIPIVRIMLSKLSEKWSHCCLAINRCLHHAINTCSSPTKLLHHFLSNKEHQTVVTKLSRPRKKKYCKLNTGAVIFVSVLYVFLLAVPMKPRPICHVVEGARQQCKTRNVTSI